VHDPRDSEQSENRTHDGNTRITGTQRRKLLGFLLGIGALRLQLSIRVERQDALHDGAVQLSS
jgi:hypothetical protein